MKQKYLIMPLLCGFLFSLLTGCGNGNRLNMDKIKETIPNITTDKISIATALVDIENQEEPYYKQEEVDYLFGDSVKEKFGVDDTWYEQADVVIHKENNSMYFIAEVKEENKNDLKNAMDAYFKQQEETTTDEKELTRIKNRKFYEVENSLFYIVHDKAEEIINIIQNAKEPVFSMIMNLTDDNIESMINVNPKLLSEYVAYIPMANVKTNLFFVLKPKRGKTEEVKKQVEQYLNNLEETFSTYLPDQYELIKNREETTYGDYLIYIVSKENDKILKAIKDCK